MAEKVETDTAARAQFWDRLGQSRVSMLWVENADQHPQPMTHFADPDAGAIWYITSSETDLARAIDGGGTGRLTFQSEKGDYQTSAVGRIDIVRDEAQLDALWSVAAAAWFEEGREDPNVRLVRFRPDEAAIWASDTSRVLVGLKILRAGMAEGEAGPDVGVHRVIGFDRAA